MNFFLTRLLRYARNDTFSSLSFLDSTKTLKGFIDSWLESTLKSLNLYDIILFKMICGA